VSDATSSPSSLSASERRQSQPWYRWYVLSVLLVAYVFNFIDRSILGILTEPIKLALGVSDTAMGFLGGPAFAVFYTLLGIPVARLADTGVRRNVLAYSVAIWSFMTAMCGLASNYWQLLAARIGVAVGEAGGSPPSHSMISDLFPQNQRATALAIYALGIPGGGMLGAFAGGWINEAFDWQTAFMVVGLPGLALALFIRFCIAEPRRGMSDGVPAAKATVAPDAAAASPAVPQSIASVFAHLWSKRSFRYLALAAACHAFVGYGIGAWSNAFFIRTHGVGTGELGTWALWLGIPALLSTFMGGWVGDLLSGRDTRWYVWLPCIATVLALPFNVFVYLWDDHVVALLVSIVPGLLGSMWLAPTFSLTQGLATLRMRAVAASIVLFILNILGLGLGPVVTGMLSDALFAGTDLGGESLRWALVTVSFVALLAALFYLLCARHLKADLASVAALERT
jgi:MFS family permease